jgi:hypothetical protein
VHQGPEADRPSTTTLAGLAASLSGDSSNPPGMHCQRSLLPCALPIPLGGATFSPVSLTWTRRHGTRQPCGPSGATSCHVLRCHPVAPHPRSCAPAPHTGFPLGRVIDVSRSESGARPPTPPLLLVPLAAALATVRRASHMAAQFDRDRLQQVVKPKTARRPLAAPFVVLGFTTGRFTSSSLGYLTRPFPPRRAIDGSHSESCARPSQATSRWWNPDCPATPRGATRGPGVHGRPFHP